MWVELAPYTLHGILRKNVLNHLYQNDTFRKTRFLTLPETVSRPSQKTHPGVGWLAERRDMPSPVIQNKQDANIDKNH